MNIILTIVGSGFLLMAFIAFAITMAEKYGFLWFSLITGFMGLILLLSSLALAETFQYKNGMQISSPSFSEAAKFCYNSLSRNKYLGEEKGLEIIDICVNPIKGKIQ